MKKRRYYIFLILLLVLSISLTGCNLFNDAEDETSSNEKELIENEIDEEEEEVKEKEKTEEVEDDEEEKEEIKDSEDSTEEEVEQPPASNTSKTSSTESKPAAVETPKTTQPQSNNAPEEVKPSDEKQGPSLKIEGKVGNSVTFTLDELKGMSDIIYTGNYYSLNNFGTTRHDEFKGANLWSLLSQKAQVQSGASKVSIVATDGYSMEFTVDQVKKQDYIDETNPDAKFPMIIAWEENGVEYSSNDGPPFKLIIGQSEPGDINKPQWVSNIDKIIVK